MPQMKMKVYSWFHVGGMMKARKQAHEEIVVAHKSIQTFKKSLDSLMEKRQRLEAKLSNSI